MTPLLIIIIISLLGFIGFMKLRIDSLKADYDALLEQASKDHASNRTELAVCKTAKSLLKEANERMKAERAGLYFRNEKGQIEAVSKKVGK
jgi:cell division protein FtsB